MSEITNQMTNAELREAIDQTVSRLVKTSGPFGQTSSMSEVIERRLQHHLDELLEAESYRAPAFNTDQVDGDEHAAWVEMVEADQETIKSLRQQVDELSAHIERIKESINTAHLDEVVADPPATSLDRHDLLVSARTLEQFAGRFQAAGKSGEAIGEDGGLNEATDVLDEAWTEAAKLRRQADQS